jgi:protein-S-isoprenylcysteine O-methyltransferase Ste14
VTGHGTRGGGWVVAQFALMALIVGSMLVGPPWPGGGPLRIVIAVVLVAAGGSLAVWAGKALGRSLTPFPRPSTGAALVESGPFRWVRHPVYGGGLLFFVGWSLARGPVTLALTAALGVLWALKSRAEERFLHAAYPGYADYARRVRWRLVPGLY